MNPPRGNPNPNLSRGLLTRLNVSTATPTARPPMRLCDVTLGGVPKKTFAPKVPLQRTREEPVVAESTESKERNQRGRKERDRERERGKGSDRGGSRGRGGRGRSLDIVQSKSIFEEAHERERVKVKSEYSSRSESRSESRSAAKKNAYEEEGGNDEDQMIGLEEFLASANFIDRGDDSFDDPLMQPIWLPLVKHDDNMLPAIKVKQEPGISVPEAFPGKSGRGDELVSYGGDDIAETNSERLVNQSAARLFTDRRLAESNTLILFQLPDVLPGKPDKRIGRNVVVKQEPGEVSTQARTMAQSSDSVVDITKEDDSSKDANLTSLKDFQEGLVGKLRVYKSGKTKLLLGDVELDVTLGTTPSCLQELVSIKVNERLSDGNMLSLGQVRHKVVVTPDFESLLELQ